MTGTGHAHGAPATATPRASTPAWRLVATLAVAGAMSGLLVSSVYQWTLPAIEQHAAEREKAAVYEVPAHRPGGTRSTWSMTR